MFNTPKKEVEFKLFDSHCHLDFAEFDRDREALLKQMTKIGIDGVLIPGVTKDKWRHIRQLTALHKKVYSAVGLHPLFIKEHRKEHLRDLELAVAMKPLWAIGEIGLDFYEKDIDRKIQIGLFKAQVEIAKSCKLPIILHVRKAHEDVLLYLKTMNFSEGGIVHAFNGSAEQAKRYAAMGFKLGFGGAFTYPGATKLRELAASLPLEDLVLETDAPDMKPVTCKKAHNTPLYLFDNFNELCKLRPEKPKEIADITSHNSRKVLRISD